MPDGNPRRAAQGRDSGQQRILIAIAGRQHADQMAAALALDGLDAQFHHAAPIRDELTGTLAGRHHFHRLVGLSYRIANRVLPGARAQAFSHAMFARFDAAVAAMLPKIAPDAVIGYENGALDIFRAARARGIPTILDAASVHHRLQAEGGLADAGTPFRQRVNARKDAEIALADHIICCSTLAARSYADAGVPADRISMVSLGFEPGLFAPDGSGAAHEGPLRIAFVGRFTRVKGADLLAEALEQLAAQGLAVECRVAAALAGGDAAMIARLGAQAVLLDKQPHEALAALYNWADILVQPSRFDSFGLVVPEALACGLPVLVSDRVGAADLVQAGHNGFVVPSGDAGALAAMLAQFARAPEKVRALRDNAIASAAGAEWPHYRRNAAATVRRILGWDRPAA